MDNAGESGRGSWSIGGYARKRCRRIVSAYTKVPYIRVLPIRALGIIGILLGANIAVWIVVGIVSHFYGGLAGTAVLAWTLGLRHALDADHISAIDLMTRRLIAANQRSVAVGTFFSLGHSTIVIITSIVVAATAATVSDKFDGFSQVGGIVGSAVSAGFLLILGMTNALAFQQGVQAPALEFRLEGGGMFFRLFKKLFRLIDRSWKMYPLGVLFGLGFDTSSQVALLGISAVQSAEGRSFWLILIFPMLFTSGMCLIDTADGALMLSLYTAGAGAKVNTLSTPSQGVNEHGNSHPSVSGDNDAERGNTALEQDHGASGRPDSLTFLYYNVILTVLTVIVAVVIGVIQVLGLVDSVSSPPGKFWDGVRTVEDKFDVVGGAICGAFATVGIGSVVLHKRWRRWILREGSSGNNRTQPRE